MYFNLFLQLEKTKAFVHLFSHSSSTERPTDINGRLNPKKGIASNFIIYFIRELLSKKKAKSTVTKCHNVWGLVVTIAFNLSFRRIHVLRKNTSFLFPLLNTENLVCWAK